MKTLKHELSDCFFSKMDVRPTFWQIDLDEKPRYLTVFNSDDNLYKQKRLTTVLKPAQGEINVALRPIFMQLVNVHLIHDDANIATETFEDYLNMIREVMQTASLTGLTLNPETCYFKFHEIKFWGHDL